MEDVSDERSGGERGGTLGEQIATYRDIAAHWRLKGWEQGDGIDAARVKAKRAKWRQLSRNHPGDPMRVAIPRAAWDSAPALQERANTTTGIAENKSTGRAARLARGNNDSLPQAAVLAALIEDRRTAEARAEALAQQLADAREQLAQQDGEAARLRDALKMAETRLHSAAQEADQAKRQLDEAQRERVETTTRAARIEGELDGMKTTAEHLHEVAAQARREERAAQDRTAEAIRKAEEADRKALEAREEVARLRARGLLARLRNRP